MPVALTFSLVLLAVVVTGALLLAVCTYVLWTDERPPPVIVIRTQNQSRRTFMAEV